MLFYSWLFLLMTVVCDFLFKYKVVFQVLELHLLYLINFNVKLNTNTLYIFIMTRYPFHFFINTWLYLINYLLLIIIIMQRKK
jgi:hypothetical protein